MKDKSVPLLIVNELIVGIHSQISGLENELSLVVKSKSLQHVRRSMVYSMRLSLIRARRRMQVRHMEH